MKQLQTHEKKIGENRFFIRPFKAFDAAFISAELINLLSPVFGVIAPLMGAAADNPESIMDMDAEVVIDKAAPALSRISGAKLEGVMKTMMIEHGNVSVEGPETDGSTVVLSEDLANEVFCGELQDMFILCFEIIRINYKGFFKKLGDRFGGLKDLLQSPMMGMSGDSASST